MPGVTWTDTYALGQAVLNAAETLGLTASLSTELVDFHNGVWSQPALEDFTFTYTWVFPLSGYACESVSEHGISQYSRAMNAAELERMAAGFLYFNGKDTPGVCHCCMIGHVVDDKLFKAVAFPEVACYNAPDWTNPCESFSDGTGLINPSMLTGYQRLPYTSRQYGLEYTDGRIHIVRPMCDDAAAAPVTFDYEWVVDSPGGHYQLAFVNAEFSGQLTWPIAKALYDRLIQGVSDIVTHACAKASKVKVNDKSTYVASGGSVTLADYLWSLTQDGIIPAAWHTEGYPWQAAAVDCPGPKIKLTDITELQAIIENLVNYVGSCFLPAPTRSCVSRTGSGNLRGWSKYQNENAGDWNTRKFGKTKYTWDQSFWYEWLWSGSTHSNTCEEFAGYGWATLPENFVAAWDGSQTAGLVTGHATASGVPCGGPDGTGIHEIFGAPFASIGSANDTEATSVLSDTTWLLVVTGPSIAPCATGFGFSYICPGGPSYPWFNFNGPSAPPLHITAEIMEPDTVHAALERGSTTLDVLCRTSAGSIELTDASSSEDIHITGARSVRTTWTQTGLTVGQNYKMTVTIDRYDAAVGGTLLGTTTKDIFFTAEATTEAIDDDNPVASDGYYEETSAVTVAV